MSAVALFLCVVPPKCPLNCRIYVEYIEVFYNRERRQSVLNYLSPIDFELLPKTA